MGTVPLFSLLAVCAALVAPASASALGISINGSVALTALQPGQTSSSAGSPVTVTGVVTPWSLSVTAESSPTPGHLRSAGAGCANSPAALVQPLHVDTTRGLVTTTVDKPSLDLGSGTTQLAHGTAADVLNLVYSQQVLPSEPLVSGCAYQITLTYTVS